MASISEDKFSGFMPNESIYQAQLDAQLKRINAYLPVSQEAFASDLASRGITRAGERTKAFYQSVIAPAAAEMATAVTGSALAYSQARMGYGLQVGQLRANTLLGMYQARLGAASNMEAANAQAKGNAMGGLFSGIGAVAGAYIGRKA
jgi:hypothetical protein